MKDAVWCGARLPDYAPLQWSYTGRILLAWRAFLRSPSRQREVAAATVLQACWRGRAGRREAAVLLRHRRLLRELLVAVDSGAHEQVQELARELEVTGGGTAARKVVTSFEQTARQAGQRLEVAAASGTLRDFQTAVQGVQRFSHMQGGVATSQAVFDARAADARQAVAAAVQGVWCWLCSLLRPHASLGRPIHTGLIAWLLPCQQSLQEAPPSS